ncbi:MAG TPA: family 10 glycosylhydrolase [Vicinamibacterales bacterium]|jgi:uncharacterized lipoprotein YddW (UPF0748 family)
MHFCFGSHVGRAAARSIGVTCTAVLTVLLLAPASAAPARPTDDREVRALWVVRTSLTSPAAVAEMVRRAQAGQFNTLLVQVRGRGDAYFNDGLEPRAAALAGQPDSFDPLAATLKLAHAQGIRVHAWINIALVASAIDAPASRGHMVYAHPEWLMVPRPLARDMVLLDAHSQLYLDKLMRWARSQSGEVEGLYASPIPQEAADATVAIVADIVSRYPVDGVHLDYIRYPNDEFDYSREALQAFKASVVQSLDESERRQRERALGPDLVGWADAFPDRWREFRRDRLTTLVTRLRESVKTRRPEALFSAAVLPDAAEASSRRLQDWGTWLQQQLLDVVCPMAYATDAAAFTAQVASTRQAAGSRQVWAGIGAYRLSSSQTIENIQIARRLGVSGVVLFSYDSLISLPKGVEYLAQVARAAFSK